MSSVYGQVLLTIVTASGRIDSKTNGIFEPQFLEQNSSLQSEDPIKLDDWFVHLLQTTKTVTWHPCLYTAAPP